MCPVAEAQTSGTGTFARLLHAFSPGVADADTRSRFNAFFSRAWHRRPLGVGGRSPADELGAVWNMRMSHDPDDPDWAEDNTSGSAGH